jgi:hypothetical protein
MVRSEESSALDFHTGIVRANKRQVNVPLRDKPWKTSSMLFRERFISIWCINYEYDLSGEVLIGRNHIHSSRCGW